MGERQAIDIRASLAGIGAMGWLAVLAIVIGLAVVVRSVGSFGEVVFASSVAGVSDPEAMQLARFVERYEQSYENNSDRFIGRSAFFVPPAPIPPAPPPPPRRDPVETPPPRDPGPPPPPSTYGGPGIAYVWDDRVTFDNDMTLIAGGEGGSGVEVISTNLPWSVKVRWREIEFDVQLFERTTPSFMVDPSENDEQAADRSGEL